MTEEVLKALAVGVPAAVAVILTVWMFLRAEEKREERRETNAKDKENERRAHELRINEMWVANIKTIVAKTDNTFRMISQALQEHEEASAERYERMGVTQNLIKLAKENLEEHK